MLWDWQTYGNKECLYVCCSTDIHQAWKVILKAVLKPKQVAIWWSPFNLEDLLTKKTGESNL